jgi:predicted molibdopterin-dependent oxidoreductase YjgC
MFRILEDRKFESIEIVLDGDAVSVPRGASVAAAMLQLDALPTGQTPISASARAPYCLMGVCFQCLMEIDGIANQRACVVEVQPGMQVRRQSGVSDLESTR